MLTAGYCLVSGLAIDATVLLVWLVMSMMYMVWLHRAVGVSCSLLAHCGEVGISSNPGVVT